MKEPRCGHLGIVIETEGGLGEIGRRIRRTIEISPMRWSQSTDERARAQGDYYAVRGRAVDGKAKNTAELRRLLAEEIADVIALAFQD